MSEANAKQKEQFTEILGGDLKGANGQALCIVIGCMLFSSAGDSIMVLCNS